MISRRGALAGVVAAAVPTVIQYLDGFWNLQLITVTAAVYAVAGCLLYRHRDVIRRRNSGLVSVLLPALLIGVPMFGVHADLPISSDLRLALWWLFLGFGLAFWGVGLETYRIADRGRSTTTPRSAD